VADGIANVAGGKDNATGERDAAGGGGGIELSVTGHGAGAVAGDGRGADDGDAAAVGDERFEEVGGVVTIGDRVGSRKSRGNGREQSSDGGAKDKPENAAAFGHWVRSYCV